MHTLLTSLALGGSQLVFVCVALLQSLAPQLLEIVAADQATPLSLAAMRTTPAADRADAGKVRARRICALRAQYGGWAEAVLTS